MLSEHGRDISAKLLSHVRRLRSVIPQALVDLDKLACETSVVAGGLLKFSDHGSREKPKHDGSEEVTSSEIVTCTSAIVSDERCFSGSFALR